MHPYRRVTIGEEVGGWGRLQAGDAGEKRRGGGKLDFVKVGRYKNKWVSPQRLGHICLHKEPLQSPPA